MSAALLALVILAADPLPGVPRYEERIDEAHAILDGAAERYGVEIVWKAPLTAYRSEGFAAAGAAWGSPCTGSPRSSWT